MPSFQPIRTERIYQKIVDQLKAMMQSGQFGPGDRLPSERETSEQLGVSRSAVREAFSALEMAGLIEVRPGEGTFVCRGDISLILARQADAGQASEVFELRCPLEGEAAALAAQRATQTDLDGIRQILDRMQIDLEAGDLGEASDWDFHLQVAVAAQNSLLVRVMHSLQESLRRSLATSRTRLYQIPGMPEQLLREHREIYRAITDRQPELARKRMVDHILSAFKNADYRDQ